MVLLEFNRIWKDDMALFEYEGYLIKYVTIHPFADELELLHQLNLHPKDCTYVGSYITLQGKLYFVEFNLYKDLKPHFGTGIYFKANNELIYSKCVIDKHQIFKEELDHWIKRVVNFLKNKDEIKITAQYQKIIN